MRARYLGPLVILCVVAAPAAAQQPAPPVPAATSSSATATTSSKVWIGRHAEIEAFLRDAEFRRFKDVPVGVTRPKQGFFDPGGLIASAVWKQLPPGRSNGRSAT